MIIVNKIKELNVLNHLKCYYYHKIKNKHKQIIVQMYGHVDAYYMKY